MERILFNETRETPPPFLRTQEEIDAMRHPRWRGVLDPDHPEIEHDVDPSHPEFRDTHPVEHPVEVHPIL